MSPAPGPRSRRDFLKLSAAVVAAGATPLALIACSGRDDDATPSPTTAGTTAAATEPPPGTATTPAPTGTATAAATLTPTPACTDDDDPTPALTEGPYFTPNSPERTSLLEPGMTGTLLTLTGLVVATDCTPIPGALIDFWQCDDAGNYDNVGYRLRGHQYTDSAGGYTLETIVPGIYPGRTRHIHVKVQAPGQRILTTQLFFPGEAQNARDGIYRQECEVTLVRSTPAMDATFDFVLALSAGSVPRT